MCPLPERLSTAPLGLSILVMKSLIILPSVIPAWRQFPGAFQCSSSYGLPVIGNDLPFPNPTFTPGCDQSPSYSINLSLTVLTHKGSSISEFLLWIAYTVLVVFNHTQCLLLIFLLLNFQCYLTTRLCTLLRTWISTYGVRISSFILLSCSHWATFASNTQEASLGVLKWTCHFPVSCVPLERRRSIWLLRWGHFNRNVKNHLGRLFQILKMFVCWRAKKGQSSENVHCSYIWHIKY